MPENENEAQSLFLEKVGQIPLVSSAISYAGSQYNALKDSNSVLSSTIVNASNTALYLAGSAAPVVNRTFGKQIAVADSLAARGIDLLTENVPAIKKPTEEILSLNPYENLKQYGYDTVQNLKDYGYTKVNDVLTSPYAQAVSQSINTAVDLTESTIDRYLPPGEGEAQANGHANNGNVIQRVGALSEKMRRRMLSQAVTQVSSFQRRSQEALEHMRFSVDLIQYAKSLEENGRKAVGTGVNTVRDQATWLWEELNKEETEEQQEAPKTVDQQVLAVARRATRNVMKTYNVTGLTTVLPDHAKNALNASISYAADVYAQLSKAQSVNDVSNVALEQMLSGITLMNSIVTSTISPFLRLVNPEGQNQQGQQQDQQQEQQQQQPQQQEPQREQQQSQEEPRSPPPPTQQEQKPAEKQAEKPAPEPSSPKDAAPKETAPKKSKKRESKS